MTKTDIVIDNIRVPITAEDGDIISLAAKQLKKANLSSCPNHENSV